MKKLFTKAVLGVCALGISTVAFAQEAAEAVAPVEGLSLDHKSRRQQA